MGVILFFGLWGVFSGAATQLARGLGLIAAYLAAGPAGRIAGVPLASALTTSLTLGTVLGTIASFVIIYAVVHLVSTALLRRFFEGGQDSQRQGLDRLLGGLLGALKAAAVLYVALCAATFLESNVSIAGKRLVFTPKNSHVMGWVRRYNLLELQQFGGVHELIKAAKVVANPRAANHDQDSPDVVALQHDPRFKALLGSQTLRKALESGDVQALLGSNHVVELLRDTRSMERIERIADSH